MGWLTDRLRRLASGLLARPQAAVAAVLVVVLVAGLGVAIAAASGFESPKPDLHDGGVWVTRRSEQRVGRMNVEINTIDVSLDAAAREFDVLQSGSHVFVMQTSPRSGLSVVDVVNTRTVPAGELPAGTQVGLGGEWAAVHNPDSGDVFVVAASGLASLDVDAASTAVGRFDGDVVMKVGLGGDVVVLEPLAGRVSTFAPGGAPSDVFDVPPVETVEAGDVTLVGSAAVVVDRERSLLHLPDGITTDLTAFAGVPVLQEPGPADTAVAVAFDDALVSVPLNGDPPEVVHNGGVSGPAAPAVVRGCVYGAWSGSGQVVRRCRGAGVEQAAFAQLVGAALRFRTNRDQVVLNELDEGKQVSWGDGEAKLISYWGDALTDDAPRGDECVEGENSQCEKETDDVQPDENGPPELTPDEFGTRPGRVVVVHPLLNDFDPDFDVLVIQPVEPLDAETEGTVSVIEDGRAVQVEVAAGSTSLNFEYTVDDGWGHQVSSTVTVTVFSNGENTAPVAGSDAPDGTTVVAGRTVRHNVLVNAYDPEGDPIKLVGARLVDGSGNGEVEYEPRWRVDHHRARGRP